MQAVLEAFLYRTLRLNPAVTVLELRTRLRGPRAYGVLLFYAFMASVTFSVTYMILEYPLRHDLGAWPDTALGDTALTVLAMTQLTLLFLIIPAYAGGSIALEREKQTLGLVQATLLTAADIVSGKLLVILAFAGILLLASLPVAAWCLMLGGVSPRQLFFVYTYLGAMALVLTTFGMVMSALQRGAMAAVVSTYGLILALHAAAPALLLAIFEMLRMARNVPGSGPNVLGVGGALTLILVVSALLGWMIYLALRSLVHRFDRLRRSFWGVFGPGVLTLLLAGAFTALLTSALLSPLSLMQPESMLVLHPYFSMSAMLYPSMADEIVRSSGGPVPNVDWALVIWGVSMVVALATSLFLWLLAIAAFRWKSRDRV